MKSIFFIGWMLLSPCILWAQPPDLLQKVHVQQNIDQSLPLGIGLYNEDGKKVRLGDYFTDKPVLMTFIYYKCPMLCPLNLKSLAQSLKETGLTPGRDYQLLAVSFDPTDMGGNSKEELAKFMRMMGRTDGRGIHFLTGPQSPIQKLTKAAGFQYAKNEENGQYAHTTAVIVLTPKGRIARYFFGLNYPPRDIKLALNEAQDNKAGSLSRTILLCCFLYNPNTGHYTLAILNLLKLAGLITIAVMMAMVWLLKRQEKRI